MAAESSVPQTASSESVAHKMGFFRVPDLLVKLSTKCLIELDAVRSPTSPLDLKLFTGLATKSPRSSFLDAGAASQNQKILLGDRVGLGLVDSLSDENPSPLGSRKVLLGSKMRITDSLTRKNSSTAPMQPGVVELKDENMSDGLNGSFMSLDDIVNSEDYTCVVSRGPNPRTTHIFGDRVFEFQGEQLMPGEGGCEDTLVSPLKGDNTMSFCCFCSEKLKEKEDIYIYQGDKAFCSVECRENFMEEEIEGEPATATDHSDPSGPSFDDGRIFQLIQ
ncbi:FCS-Like Zinc finger 8 [Lolium rigidum]|uniref:FCS-Like Zinc finger 8 n=1 Tax=Lolium rigidum TaxID=89674 RepID=UPI001F5DE71D|nr:FCS-Like Zinc finger 8 [Lolium rigidum]